MPLLVPLLTHPDSFFPRVPTKLMTRMMAFMTYSFSAESGKAKAPKRRSSRVCSQLASSAGWKRGAPACRRLSSRSMAIAAYE